MGLSKPEIDLGVIAARVATRDRSLEQLIAMAQVAGLGITVVCGGLVIDGDLATGVAWGKALDEAVHKALGGDFRERLIEAGFEEGEGLEALVSVFEKTSFEEVARKRVEADGEHLDRMGQAVVDGADLDLGELPEDLARAEILQAGRYPAITLVNARVRGASSIGVPSDVGTVRVITSQVAAWWPGRFAEPPGR